MFLIKRWSNLSLQNNSKDKFLLLNLHQRINQILKTRPV